MKKIFVLALATFLLSACGTKTTQNKITPTPAAPKLVEMAQADRPYISLVPRDDGHMINLNIKNIPSYIKQIEYELLYTASDNGNEIEKGVGDTVKDIKPTLERSLLLGTESCTSGCKYKYDDGVYGGTLTLNFISDNGQMSTFETTFSIKSSTDFKKSGNIKLDLENLTINAKPTDKNFYILMKNYSIKGYSVFSAVPSSTKYLSILPNTVTKSDQLLTGDYLLP